LRIGCASILAAWLLPYFWLTDRFTLLDHADLAIHEAGHVVFAPFGEFLGIAGGTLLQLIVPLVFCCYFALRRDFYAASILVFWLSQSLFNVATYMADARAQVLPLVGGEYVIHDWAWMLSRLRLLRQDETLASLVRAIAALLWFGALGGALLHADHSHHPAPQSRAVSI
jgi:hypothetical protein